MLSTPCTPGMRHCRQTDKQTNKQMVMIGTFQYTVECICVTLWIVRGRLLFDGITFNRRLGCHLSKFRTDRSPNSRIVLRKGPQPTWFRINRHPSWILKLIYARMFETKPILLASEMYFQIFLIRIFDAKFRNLGFKGFFQTSTLNIGIPNVG